LLDFSNKSDKIDISNSGFAERRLKINGINKQQKVVMDYLRAWVFVSNYSYVLSP
jgi:hypothetical protein